MKSPRFLLTVGIIVLTAGIITFNGIGERRSMSSEKTLKPPRESGGSIDNTPEESATTNANQIDNNVMKSEMTDKEKIAYMRFELELLKKGYNRISKLENKIDRLKNQLDIIETGASGSEQIADIEYKSTQPEDSKRPKSPMETTGSDPLAAIETTFNSQQIDDDWASKMTDFITEGSSNVSNIGGTLSNLDCRTTVCRVEMQFNDQQAIEEFALQFPIQMSGALPNIVYDYEHHVDGQITMTMYLETGTGSATPSQ